MRNFGDPAPQYNDTINLPSLISDELGVSRSTARMEIAMGTVEIDGVESREKFDFKRAELAGKTVTVLGERRSFRLQIPAD